jgi:hypothetical protein
MRMVGIFGGVWEVEEEWRRVGLEEEELDGDVVIGIRDDVETGDFLILSDSGRCKSFCRGAFLTFSLHIFLFRYKLYLKYVDVVYWYLNM